MNKITFTLIVVLGWSVVSAQPFGPAFPAPFGFVEILIGAGALWGGKKAYDSKKGNKNEA